MSNRARNKIQVVTTTKTKNPAIATTSTVTIPTVAGAPQLAPNKLDLTNLSKTQKKKGDWEGNDYTFDPADPTDQQNQGPPKLFTKSANAKKKLFDEAIRAEAAKVAADPGLIQLDPKGTKLKPKEISKVRKLPLAAQFQNVISTSGNKQLLFLDTKNGNPFIIDEWANVAKHKADSVMAKLKKNHPKEFDEYVQILQLDPQISPLHHKIKKGIYTSESEKLNNFKAYVTRLRRKAALTKDPIKRMLNWSADRYAVKLTYAMQSSSNKKRTTDRKYYLEKTTAKEISDNINKFDAFVKKISKTEVKGYADVDLRNNLKVPKKDFYIAKDPKEAIMLYDLLRVDADGDVYIEYEAEKNVTVERQTILNKQILGPIQQDIASDDFYFDFLAKDHKSISYNGLSDPGLEQNAYKPLSGGFWIALDLFLSFPKNLYDLSTWFTPYGFTNNGYTLKNHGVEIKAIDKWERMTRTHPGTMKSEFQNITGYAITGLAALKQDVVYRDFIVSSVGKEAGDEPVNPSPLQTTMDFLNSTKINQSSTTPAYQFINQKAMYLAQLQTGQALGAQNQQAALIGGSASNFSGTKRQRTP